MRTLGIIVEYNPLHNGHIYHFEESVREAKADAVIAVMSGNFLQRGEPALVNKWARAEMALHMGADLVIELPVAYACAPAEWFAFGSVSALHATGIVDALCFGSESGEIGRLKQLAAFISQESSSFQKLVKLLLKKGINYPSAYHQAIQAYVQHDSDAADLPDLSQPNNTLGLHYLIALHRLNSAIQPLTITRHAAGYHQESITDRQIASATAIRKRIFSGENLRTLEAYMPTYTLDILEREQRIGRAPIAWHHFMRPLMHLITSRTPEAWSDYEEVAEGLEHRIYQKALQVMKLGKANDFETLLASIKTKRYTRTKLQRTLLRILLGHQAADLGKRELAQGVPYLRVLGFSATGRSLLKIMKDRAIVPVITNLSRQAHPFLEMDIRATQSYSLAYPSHALQSSWSDYEQAPVQL